MVCVIMKLFSSLYILTLVKVFHVHDKYIWVVRVYGKCLELWFVFARNPCARYIYEFEKKNVMDTQMLNITLTLKTYPRFWMTMLTS